jgi:hypothetical protein
MTDQGELRRVLDKVSLATPESTPPTRSDLERVCRRLRRAKLMAATGVATFVLVGGAAVVSTMQDDSRGSVAVDPEPSSVPTGTATPEASELPCPAKSKARDLCPVDGEGLRRWVEVREAFTGKLAPISVVGGNVDCCGDNLPAGTRIYSFHAHLETGSDATRPEVMVQVTIPPTPQRTTPSIVYHPGFPSEFERGEGIVTITQGDGTTYWLRAWGAQDLTDPGTTDPVAIDLLLQAVADLAAR